MNTVNKATGVYLHVPFCRAKCPYCDFYSLPFDEDLADRYSDALIRAMERQPFYLSKADTLYFGGGTPTLLGAKRLERLLQKAAECFGITEDSEVTIEANPDTVTRALMRALRQDCGFNRISMGVQSANDDELRALGRPHTAERAAGAVMDAWEGGFNNISVDLMLAIPGQTPESLASSIETLTGLPITHLSAYLLKTEPGTAFYQNRDNLNLPDEDMTAELYLQCVEQLATAGFAQYEISNFAKEGFASRHNLIYWRGGQYLGIGPAAHSFIYNDSHLALAGAASSPTAGKRYSFGRDLRGFLEEENPWKLLQPEGDGGDLEEQMMLALRLTSGFDTSLLPQHHLDPAPLINKAEELSRHGLCRVKNGVIALTPQGFLLSNSITVALMEVLEKL